MMEFFEMRWPVLDPDMPRAELLREAAADLQRELPALGLRPLSHPVFTWHPGPWLVARCAVATHGAFEVEVVGSEQ